MNAWSHRKSGYVSLGLVCLAACLSLNACGGGSGEPSATGSSSGGTIKGASTFFPDYLDPQLSYTGWTTMYVTYLPLLTYEHAEGTRGTKVIPGLAKALPEISNGGKTYTLFLRPGLRYSDGQPVKASDFKYAVERCIKLNSGGSPFYMSIVGASKLTEDKHATLAGIETDDRSGKIVINLEKPRSTFVNELAFSFSAPVPRATPLEDQTAHPPPSTGPYEIVEARPGQKWTLARNPEWAETNSKRLPQVPRGHFEKIEMEVDANQSTQVNDIEQGTVDFLTEGPPTDRYQKVKEKYEGTQFRVEPSISTFYFWMNTTTPPFNDLKVRQAVNYAVNHEALERIYTGQIIGTQQILPPGMPGYKHFELYPYDLAKAKQLIAEAAPTDKDITIWTAKESPNDDAGTYYQGVLEELGFNAKLKIVNAENYWAVIGNSQTANLDTGYGAWIEDYPHPSDFFQLVYGKSIQPTNNFNFSQVKFPALDKQFERLNEEQLGPRQEAEYAQLDREYMEEAVWAPYGTRSYSLFVSSDIDLESAIWTPTFLLDLTSLQPK